MKNHDFPFYFWKCATTYRIRIFFQIAISTQGKYIFRDKEKKKVNLTWWRHIYSMQI